MGLSKKEKHIELGSQTDMGWEVSPLTLSFLACKRSLGRVQWLTPIIPALWEAEAGRSRGQEIETIQANMVKPCLY